MFEENKSLGQRIHGLKRLFEESKEEAKYYQRVAEKTGKRRLREIDQLSKLITQNKRTWRR